MYCVYFTTYSGQKMPPFYIGSGLISNILTKNYHGSVVSKNWKNVWCKEILDNPQLFHTEVVSVHKTRQDAYDAEELYQRREDVVKSNMYINECYANCGFNFKNCKHSENTRKKISQKKLGQHLKESTKVKISQKKIGSKASEKTKVKMSLTKSKPVLCIELNQKFKSCQEAALHINGKKSGWGINQCARGITKQAYGYTWKFLQNG